jgi:hypothetical protein
MTQTSIIKIMRVPSDTLEINNYNQMKGTIFLKALRHILDPVDRNTPRKTWDIVFCTLSGKVVKGKVVCTSSNFQNDTFNFKFPESGEVRNVHAQLLLSVNGKEVML